MAGQLPSSHPNPADREQLRKRAIALINEGQPLGKQLAIDRLGLVPYDLHKAAEALALQHFPGYSMFELAHVIAGIKMGYDPQQYGVVLE